MPDAETGTQWGLSIDQPQDRQTCAQVSGLWLHPKEASVCLHAYF